MEEESKQYTAFSCAHGKFQYKVMPLGLKNAPATFQLLMQRILAGCEEFALPYIDDIIIYSTSFTVHLTHINTTLQRLADNELTVKCIKSSWCYTAFEFLGFIVGKGGIAIPQARVEYMAKSSATVRGIGIARHCGAFQLLLIRQRVCGIYRPYINCSHFFIVMSVTVPIIANFCPFTLQVSRTSLPRNYCCTPG